MFLTSTLLAAAAIAAAVWVWPELSGAPSGTQTKYISILDVTPKVLMQAKDAAAPYTKPASSSVVAGLVPHHLLAAPLLQGFFAGLADRESPRTVVIIGPDHHSRANSAAVSTDRGWSGPNGTVAVDHALITKLVGKKLITLDNSTIEREHSVYTIVPFVHQRWPQAMVVVIALRPAKKDSTLVYRLGQTLNGLLSNNDLVIASVDLSHYQDVPTATAEDTKTLDLIKNGDWSSLQTAPVDSPEALAAMMVYAKLRRASFQLIAHTNSAELIGDPGLTSTTSYATAYFQR